MPQTPLSRKTKSELLEEYHRLQEKFEELKMTSQFVHKPENLELFEKTKDYTTENLTQSFGELKKSLNVSIDQLVEKLLAESQKLSELQEAIAISKKNLEVQYNIQVAAATLQSLVEENDRKTREFQETQEGQERDWTRELEEYGYQTNLKRRREEETYQEERTRKEKEFADREKAIKDQEVEIAKLKAQAEQFPQELEKALKQREEQLGKNLREQVARDQEAAKKDWQAEKNVYELKLQNLQDLLKRQQVEIAALRQEGEQANRKAQELAVKIIEAGAHTQSQTEEEKPPQSS